MEDTASFVLGLGSLVLGIGLLVATVAGTYVAYRHYRMATDPHVIVYPVLARGLVLLVVENIGKGVAFDVVLMANKQLPPASLLEESAEPLVSPGRSRPFGAIAPRERRVFTLAKPGQDAGELKHDTKLTVEFGRTYLVNRGRRALEYPISIQTFMGALFRESVNPQVRLAAASEGVERSNQDVAQQIRGIGSRGIHVSTEY